MVRMVPTMMLGGDGDVAGGDLEARRRLLLARKQGLRLHQEEEEAAHHVHHAGEVEMGAPLPSPAPGVSVCGPAGGGRT